MGTATAAEVAAAAMAPRPQATRLARELEEFVQNPPDGCKVSVGKSLSVWVVTLTGAEGTAFAGEKYKLRVAFPQPDIAANREARTERADADEPRSDVYVGMGDLEIDVDELNLCLDW